MSESAARKVFSRGVGKSIFGYFLIAAVVPMLFTGWLAYHEFNRGSEREAARMLKAEAKEYGVEILTRLQLADGKAHEIVRILTQEGVGSIAGHSYLVDDFEGIWLAQDNGPPIAVPGFPGLERRAVIGAHSRPRRHWP